MVRRNLDQGRRWNPNVGTCNHWNVDIPIARPFPVGSQLPTDRSHSRILAAPEKDLVTADGLQLSKQFLDHPRTLIVCECQRLSVSLVD